jgi:hypothetical protein
MEMIEMRNRVLITITIGLDTVMRLEKLRREQNYPISRILEDSFLEVHGDKE